MVRTKVNPPEEFRGEIGKLKTFLTQCSLYIFWNPTEFDTEKKEVMFMVSYIRG
jgi:hypothetical protein